MIIKYDNRDIAYVFNNITLGRRINIINYEKFLNVCLEKGYHRLFISKFLIYAHETVMSRRKWHHVLKFTLEIMDNYGAKYTSNDDKECVMY